MNLLVANPGHCATPVSVFCKRAIAKLPLLLAVLFMASCVSPAFMQIDDRAEQLGFVRSTQQSEKFRHVIYSPQREMKGDSVNVYIEGDGVAWQWRYFVKADPTPRSALMLDLMGQDAGNALYVGRPCYFGMALDEYCNADYWTFSRFSEKIVESMAEVIGQRTGQYQKVVLIGHSGGGALALLLAEKLPKVTTVVTVAGNIDTEAWIQHHKYTPLYGSINPATRQALPETIKQLHLVGGQDQVIPPALVKGWVAMQPSAQLWEIPGNNHMCCWANDWPKVLRWISRATAGRLPVSEKRI